ncbi:uncharacterized protein LOC141725155 isoform X1 [Apium graveolens]|uniref:uncharacterized protein LOC141725155 isoform X1 n=1 Tax=Apium graveolens TaxID=4045 RepID=UPI003D7ABF74
MMKLNQFKTFLPKCFFLSLFFSIFILFIISLNYNFKPGTSFQNHPPPSHHQDIRIRPGYSSYDAYIQHQLNKTLNPKLRQIWTTRDWDRKIQVFSIFFNNFKRKNLLTNSSKALCIGARVGQEVEALKRVGVTNSVGIDLVPYPPLVIKGDFHNQPFENDTFDFEFSNVFDHALYPYKFVEEIQRTLKAGGICVLHVAVSRRSDKYSANDLYNVRGLKALFDKSECVSARKVDGFGLDTELVFRKNNS